MERLANVPSRESGDIFRVTTPGGSPFAWPIQELNVVSRLTFAPGLS